MEKLTTNIPQTKWGTIKSKYKPESNYVSINEFTSGSYNFITNNTGAVEKRPTSVEYNPIALTNVGKDQFEAIFANGVHHLLFMDGGDLKYTTGDGVMSTADTGYTTNANMEYQMFQNRVYFDNGVDNPAVYDLTASYGGVTYTPPQVKDMGAQPPGSAVTFGADTGTGLTGSFHYKVTFLYYGEEESNGGPASALHTVANKTINLTAVPVGGYGVTARKIYRDANDGVYVLVGTISDNTTTTFADSTTAGTTPIPTANNTPPIFRYIALNLSRLWVAGVSGTPNTIYWSNPGLPDIFDPDNFIECNPGDPIQAIYVYQGITVVLNRHSVGQITGTTDDTFAYQQVPGSVGCTDNRSIQIRTISGVPILVWLSDRGIYGFNGSSVEYLSDDIEDEVNLNIQQSNFVNGAVSQSTAADWAAGTSSPGIDLASNPGTITTINPTRIFESQADWETGTLTNLATVNTGNAIQVPTRFVTSLASGTLGGNAILSGVNLTLPTIPDSVGLLTSDSGNTAQPWTNGMSVGTTSGPDAIAQSFSVPFAGTVTSLTYSFTIGSNVGGTYIVYIWTNNNFNQPGTIIWQSSPIAFSSGFNVNVSGTVTPGQSIAAGSYFWGIIASGSGVRTIESVKIGTITSGTAPANTICSNRVPQGGSPFVDWGPAKTGPSGSVIPAFNWQLNFSQTAISSSGTWTSTTYDSKSVSSAVSASVINSATYPTSTSATLFVDESNDPTMTTGLSTFSQANPNGTYSPGLSGKRYWRLRYSIATTDNRRAPTLAVPELRFNTTGIWVSPAIETTLDGTSFISLPAVTNVPVGTSVLVQIRTSLDGMSWSAYSDISTATINRYAQIRITLTATSDDSSTASVTSVQLNWNLSSTFTSSIIDIGVVPTGWGIFQDVAATNGGTETFSMRSAASSGAIPGATFYTVTNGNFPNTSILPLQFTQWKVVLAATPNHLPTVDSVTINYVTGVNQSPIRVASLFFNKTYYLAAAETGQTANNVVIVYDFEGNWRIFRDVNINSLSLFFNAPYFLDSVRKHLYQWLIPPTGISENITMDFRTKAFDLGDTNRLKCVRSMCVIGINTGTTVHAYYSVDRGATWIEMLNSFGVTGFTTSTDGNKFDEYFVPDYDLGATTSGTTIMFRVTSTDAFPCTILSLDAVLYYRKGKYLGRPV